VATRADCQRFDWQRAAGITLCGEVSPRGHFWQLIVQAEGWHDEPLSVVLSDFNGQSTPVRGDRFYVGGLNGRIYSGDDQLQPVALAKSA